MSLEEKYPRLSETEDYNLKHVIECVLTSRGIVADSGLVAELAAAVEEFYAQPEPVPVPDVSRRLLHLPAPAPQPEPAPPVPSAEPSVT